MPLLRRCAAAALLALLAMLTLTGCFSWAHRECADHGGLNHVGKVGNSYVGVCNDGKWVTP